MCLGRDTVRDVVSDTCCIIQELDAWLGRPTNLLVVSFPIAWQKESWNTFFFETDKAEILASHEANPDFRLLAWAISHYNTQHEWNIQVQHSIRTHSSIEIWKTFLKKCEYIWNAAFSCIPICFRQVKMFCTSNLKMTHEQNLQITNSFQKATIS